MFGHLRFELRDIVGTKKRVHVQEDSLFASAVSIDSCPVYTNLANGDIIGNKSF